MPDAIQPTGQGGQQRQARRQAQAVWTDLQPANWAALSAAQRWEIVRKVLVFVLRREFQDLS